jgi:hypothetical protein
MPYRLIRSVWSLVVACLSTGHTVWSCGILRAVCACIARHWTSFNFRLVPQSRKTVHNYRIFGHLLLKCSNEVQIGCCIVSTGNDAIAPFPAHGKPGTDHAHHSNCVKKVCAIQITYPHSKMLAAKFSLKYPNGTPQTQIGFVQCAWYTYSEDANGTSSWGV